MKGRAQVTMSPHAGRRIWILLQTLDQSQGCQPTSETEDIF